MPEVAIYDPLDPEYLSPASQIARLQHVLDYMREHVPDAETEAWLLARIEGVQKGKG